MTIEWVTVGNPGHAADTEVMNDGTTSYGSVPYAYRIAAKETTNAQYAEFLNAVAQADPYALYHPQMGLGEGGIARNGSVGSYTYTPIAGRADMPVNYVSFYDALRFANWLHNGQGSGDTETGAYTLMGGTPEPTNGATVTRSPGATVFLPTEDEWYKAAYYDAVSTSYFDYPAGSDAQTVCALPGSTLNTANCQNSVGDLTGIGSYPNSLSPYGTYDQGGNVFEWNETLNSTPPEIQTIPGSLPPLPTSGPFRSLRGGSSTDPVSFLAASGRTSASPEYEFQVIGFRVASPVPEPRTAFLVASGLLAIAARRRVHARRPVRSACR